MHLPFTKDFLLLAAELTARNIYWRSPWLRNWAKKRQRRSLQTQRIIDRQELLQRLQEIGVCEGALVMAHTSITGLSMQIGTKPGELSSSPLQTATMLMNALFDLVGNTGTLLMPTNPLYENAKDAIVCKDSDDIPVYDPTRTPCCVGLVNEMFWRHPGVQRSLHPYNSLAARGPLAEELLRDNLNEHKPLPHGVYSGYYRFCQRNGLVISIGVPLGHYMTFMHTAEDVRDQDWPVSDFFEEKQYIVRINGQERVWTIRERSAKYSKFCFCRNKFVRDLRREGILHESTVGNIHVDWVHSCEVIDFLMQRNHRFPYPYYGTRVVRMKKAKLS